MKRVLITGKGSYIGSYFRDYLKEFPNDYYVEELDVRDDSWKQFDFSKFVGQYILMQVCLAIGL